MGEPDRSRHADGAPQVADVRRPDPRGAPPTDQEPVPRHPCVRLRWHLGLVPPAPSGRPDLQLRRRGDARREGERLRREVRHPGQPQRHDQPARRGARRVPHPAGPHRTPEVARQGQVRRHRTGPLHRRRLRAHRRDLRQRTTARRRDALLGRRRGRRGAAPDGEGPDDRYRDDRVPLGRIRLRAVRAALLTARLPEPSAHQAVLHQERTGCVGRRAAVALGQRLGQGDRQPDGLRLRRAAPVLVLPPPVGLGRRRRLHRADGGLDPQVQLHGRHPVPHRDASPPSARRTASTWSRSNCT